MKRILRSIVAAIFLAASVVPVLPAERAAASSGRILYMGINSNEVITNNPSGTDRQVIANGHSPLLSPDATKVAYSSEGGNISVVAITGGTPVQITANTNQSVVMEGFSWSPDSTEVLFTELTYLPDGGGTDYAHIIRAKADGSSRIAVSAGLNDVVDRAAQMSPDGTQIIFTSNDISGPNPNPQPSLMKMQADGTNRQLIEEQVSNPSWSPNGQYITYTANAGSGNELTAIINADGTNRKTIPNTYLYLRPVWSPAGDTFLASGISNITIIRTDGTIAQTISHATNTAITTPPTWTADGQTILYESMGGGPAGLYGRALHTGPRKLLFNDPQYIYFPQWYGPGGVVIDDVGPTIAVQPFGSPITANQPWELIVAANDFSPIIKGEYFIGTDPGQGNANHMDYNGDAVTHFFVEGFTPGEHIVNVRALDSFGNWSAVLPIQIIAESPQSPNPPGITGVTGNRTVRPRLNSGDTLPGLTSNNQTNTATFNLNVKFAGQGTATPASDLTFSYQTGTFCNIPFLARNCHSFAVDASVINSLTINGQNNSQSTFEGTAAVSVDGGAASDRTFRVQATDGTRQTPRVTDRLTLEVFAAGQGSQTTPQYKVSQPIQAGNIRIN